MEIMGTELPHPCLGWPWWVRMKRKVRKSSDVKLHELGRTPKINCIYSTQKVRWISFYAGLILHNWLITRKCVSLSPFSGAVSFVFLYRCLHKSFASCLCLRRCASALSHVVVGQSVGWKAGGSFLDLFSRGEKLILLNTAGKGTWYL